MELEKLEEMIREQERALRLQLRGIEEEDEKSLRMIQLSIAALAGGVALSTVVLRTPGPVSSPSIVWIAAAAGLNLLALVLFVDAYVGFTNPSDAHIGPTPSWTAEKARDESGWTLERHLLAQIERNPSFFRHNLAVVEGATRRRRKGIYLLLTALFTYAGGYIYILSEVI